MFKKALATAAMLVTVAVCTNVAVASPVWFDSTEIIPSNDASLVNTTPELAVDSAGNAVALVEFDDGTGQILKASVKLSGTTEWSTPVRVAPGESGISEFQIASLANGDTLALWINPSAATVESSTLPAGSTDAWTTPQIVATAASGHSFESPVLRASTNGAYVAVWTDYSSTGTSSIQAATGEDTGSWGAATTISDLSLTCITPDVSINGSGEIAAIWRDASDEFIQSSESKVGEAWSTPVAVFTDNTATTPAILIDEDGNETAVWRRTAPTSGRGVQTLSKASGSTAWPAASEAEYLSAEGLSINDIKVAVSPTGKTVATWEETSNQMLQVASRNTPGEAWTTSNLTSEIGADIVGGDVAFSANGQAQAVWVFDADSGGDDSIVQHSTLEADSSEWSTPQDISNSGLFNENPRIGVDSDGDAVATWNSYATDGSTGEYTESASYDANDPTITSFPSFPADAAKPGATVEFFATASDFSPITSYSWSFGDGSSANVADTSHSYSTAGDYTAKFTVTDAAGKTTSKSALIGIFETINSVTDPATTGTSPTTTVDPGPPVLSGLKISKKKIKRSYLKRQLKRKRSGLKISFTTDLDASVTASFYLKKGKKELKRSSFTKSVKAGKNTLTIPVKVAKKLRKRGKYTLKLTAAGSTSTSNTLKITFRVI